MSVAILLKQVLGIRYYKVRDYNERKNVFFKILIAKANKHSV